jgi:hypothetical protein
MVARLQAIESEFAVDSTGISVSKFTKWHNKKHVERSGCNWVRARCCVGVKTHCILAAAIYDRDTGDSPVLPELVSFRTI